jgi:hypothetical protein
VLGTGGRSFSSNIECRAIDRALAPEEMLSLFWAGALL